MGRKLPGFMRSTRKARSGRWYSGGESEWRTLNAFSATQTSQTAAAASAPVESVDADGAPAVGLDGAEDDAEHGGRKRQRRGGKRTCGRCARADGHFAKTCPNPCQGCTGNGAPGNHLPGCFIDAKLRKAATKAAEKKAKKLSEPES